MMHAPWQLHIIAIFVVISTLTAEVGYLFVGPQVASGIPEVLIGRILGTLDAALVVVLSYYFSASLPPVRSGMTRAGDVSVPHKEGDAK